MPSLSTTEPMSSLALAPLDALSTHLDTLVTSLVHTNTFAAAPAAANSLVAADDDLTSALTALKRHQQNYTRILHLREETLRLEDELKNVIRKAVSLREDVGRIHPSILDDEDEDSSEEGDGQEVKDVDYQTLLNFAARIGKHNSLAAREAEREWEKRKIDALKKNAGSPTAASNIASALAKASAPAPPRTTADATDTNGASNTDAEQQPEKDALELQALDLEASLAATRAQQGLGYPDGMLLRMGELGRLQKIREDAMDAAREKGDTTVGDEAVEKEIERLVRESEEVAPTTAADDEDERMSDDGERETDDPKRSLPVSSQTKTPRDVEPQAPRPAATVTAPKRKKISLDLGGDDEDDDDD